MLLNFSAHLLKEVFVEKTSKILRFVVPSSADGVACLLDCKLKSSITNFFDNVDNHTSSSLETDCTHLLKSYEFYLYLMKETLRDDEVIRKRFDVID
ncbi:hypothetical protein WA026_006161 [Henosepilachna vigintioctopunctata]|uniref:Uncharacterized protein n=1 Tax=Henosepilachna vigintioctopunctata TaxID=420089 RepID=A0AAW1TPG8_9CUCU